jgi:hypothetical protein
VLVRAQPPADAHRRRRARLCRCKSCRVSASARLTRACAAAARRRSHPCGTPIKDGVALAAIHRRRHPSGLYEIVMPMDSGSAPHTARRKLPARSAHSILDPQDDANPPSIHDASGNPAARLSEREREIMALVAMGRDQPSLRPKHAPRRRDSRDTHPQVHAQARREKPTPTLYRSPSNAEKSHCSESCGDRALKPPCLANLCRLRRQDLSARLWRSGAWTSWCAARLVTSAGAGG